jgi:hypothetical protein
MHSDKIATNAVTQTFYFEQVERKTALSEKWRFPQKEHVQVSG